MTDRLTEEIRRQRDLVELLENAAADRRIYLAALETLNAVVVDAMDTVRNGGEWADERIRLASAVVGVLDILDPLDPADAEILRNPVRTYPPPIHPETDQ